MRKRRRNDINCEMAPARTSLHVSRAQPAWSEAPAMKGMHLSIVTVVGTVCIRVVTKSVGGDGLHGVFGMPSDEGRM